MDRTSPDNPPNRLGTMVKLRYTKHSYIETGFTQIEVQITTNLAQKYKPRSRDFRARPGVGIVERLLRDCSMESSYFPQLVPELQMMFIVLAFLGDIESTDRLGRLEPTLRHYQQNHDMPATDLIELIAAIMCQVHSSVLTTMADANGRKLITTVFASLQLEFEGDFEIPCAGFYPVTIPSTVYLIEHDHETWLQAVQGGLEDLDPTTFQSVMINRQYNYPFETVPNSLIGAPRVRPPFRPPEEFELDFTYFAQFVVDLAVQQSSIWKSSWTRVFPSDYATDLPEEESMIPEAQLLGQAIIEAAPDEDDDFPPTEVRTAEVERLSHRIEYPRGLNDAPSESRNQLEHLTSIREDFDDVDSEFPDFSQNEATFPVAATLPVSRYSTHEVRGEAFLLRDETESFQMPVGRQRLAFSGVNRQSEEASSHSANAYTASLNPPVLAMGRPEFGETSSSASSHQGLSQRAGLFQESAKPKRDAPHTLRPAANEAPVSLVGVPTISAAASYRKPFLPESNFIRKYKVPENFFRAFELWATSYGDSISLLGQWDPTWAQAEPLKQLIVDGNRPKAIMDFGIYFDSAGPDFFSEELINAYAYYTLTQMPIGLPEFNNLPKAQIEAYVALSTSTSALTSLVARRVTRILDFRRSHGSDALFFTRLLQSLNNS